MRREKQHEVQTWKTAGRLAIPISTTMVATFWYVNEYYTLAGQVSSTAGWQTRIGSFKLPGCQAK
jgi:hypothetical protein